MPPDARRELATTLWRTINLVNLRDHITAERDLADLIVTFDEHHQVRAIQPP
jgi:hypothetical protein